jgi:hypothetical protein
MVHSLLAEIMLGALTGIGKVWFGFTLAISAK